VRGLGGIALALAAAAAIGCGDDAPAGLDRDALLDPDTCLDCHPNHVAEWRGSMHAYASDDPIFRAMNARGQRETGGELGDFCVKCHAPMAVRDGLTTDGLNLDELPPRYKGVTCFFCHTAEEVEGDHDNPIVLADDRVLRGGFGDAIDNGVHATAYSPLLDHNNDRSSELCGSCHDLVTPAGVHLERTYAEYRDSIFPTLAPNGVPATLTCGDCHAKGVPDVVADFDGVPLRQRHLHTFPGVDQATTPWPDRERQREEIDRLLSSFLAVTVCRSPVEGGQIQVKLTSDAGHMFPSGASQDRRAWVEVRAYVGEEVVYQSGVVPEGGSVDDLVEPDLWVLRDHGFDADGEEAHMFWDIASVESQLLPPSRMLGDDHSVLHAYPLATEPDRIEVAVRMRAVGRDVLDDLIGSGDLSPELRDVMPVLTIGGSEITWTAAAAGIDQCVP
jgi:hypothetical protein